ncbi:MAG: 4-hydroxy-tetrahydrodipicolinate reductase [Alphaproteobacteria bacterium]
MTNITILGAGGRMGQLLLDAVLESNHQLTGAVVKKGDARIGKVISGQITFSDDTSAAIANSQVAIDFSINDQCEAHAALAAKHGTAYLCGVTGLLDKTITHITSHKEKIPILLAANTSFGVMGLLELAKKAVDIFAKDYNITIEETHHIDKKDKPSGTAKILGNAIGDRMKKNNITTKDIKYLSHRTGDVVGIHEIIFSSKDDEITLKHNAKNRKMFAIGAVRAAAWLAKQPPNIYSMKDFLQ